ncbi:hypothetical protein [Streptomyces sp. CBMA123]|uniref:hypothetical protein n=1 Tax=Streptomyces sp. CBMA123 TaxID=1896313 RepID=UPI001661E980|nr:hypothetical protein [Streptomyces sp. CBMA123]MBD0689961.1 hypothetical protein [Streptomyces sp. CBMA123]
MRDRLLENQLLVLVGLGALLPLPAVLTWQLINLFDELRKAEPAGNLIQGLFGPLALVLMVVAVSGGAIRLIASQNASPCVKAVCNALILTQETALGQATTSQVITSVDGAGKFLVGRARMDPNTYLRKDMVAHAEQVHEALRAKARQLQMSGSQAAGDLAPLLAKLLDALSAETYLNLLDPEDLPEPAPAPAPSRRRIAALVLLGLGLLLAVSWGMTALGAPGTVVTPALVVAAIVPLYIWGGPRLVRAQDLLRLLTGGLLGHPEPPTEVATDTQGAELESHTATTSS